MGKSNTEVRFLVRMAGLKYQDIAKELDITSSYLSRIMSKPLSAENKAKIIGICTDRIKAVYTA